MVTHIKWGNFSGFTKAMEDVYDFFEDLKPTMKQCSKLKDIFTTFSSLSNPITFPAKLGYNLYSYSSQIETNCSDAMDYWDASNYYKFGKSIGQVMKYALG